jgi:hypothetical protein
MDLAPELRDAVREVAGVLHRYAENKGWKHAPYGDFSRGDYFLDVRANEDWGTLDVTFVAEEFAKRDRFQVFNEVQDWLEKELEKDPSLAGAVALVVKSPSEYERGSLGPHDFPIDDELIRSVIPSARK